MEFLGDDIPDIAEDQTDIIKIYRRVGKDSQIPHLGPGLMVLKQIEEAHRGSHQTTIPQVVPDIG